MTVKSTKTCDQTGVPMALNSGWELVCKYDSGRGEWVEERFHFADTDAMADWLELQENQLYAVKYVAPSYGDEDTSSFHVQAKTDNGHGMDVRGVWLGRGL